MSKNQRLPLLKLDFFFAFLIIHLKSFIIHKKMTLSNFTKIFFQVSWIKYTKIRKKEFFFSWNLLNFCNLKGNFKKKDICWVISFFFFFKSETKLHYPSKCAYTYRQTYLQFVYMHLLDSMYQHLKKYIWGYVNWKQILKDERCWRWTRKMNKPNKKKITLIMFLRLSVAYKY